MTQKRKFVMPLTVLAGLFTVADAQALGSTSLADLLYDPSTGDVSVDASEASGAIVTSYQLENGSTAFIPGNYTGPGGNFGGVLEDVTASVVADTDPTGTGFSGTHNFGSLLAYGLLTSEVESLLTTSVYTGAAGSGQQTFEVFSTLLMGDVNKDGSVGFVDLNLLLGNYNGPTTGQTWSTGDMDGDGDVGFSDLNRLLGNYNQSLSVAASQETLSQDEATAYAYAAIPEPSSLALIALGGAMCLRRRRGSDKA